MHIKRKMEMSIAPFHQLHHSHFRENITNEEQQSSFLCSLEHGVCPSTFKDLKDVTNRS